MSLVRLIDRFRTEITRAHASPPSCARVAAEYHSDMRWWDDPSMALHGAGVEREWEMKVQPNRMRAMSAVDQRALINHARAAIEQACNTEKWSAWVRACVEAGWTTELQRSCLVGIDGSFAAMRRWTAPPLELVETKVPECDAYLKSVRALAACAPSDQIEGAIAEAARWAATNVRSRQPANDAASCDARRTPRRSRGRAAGADRVRD